MENMVKNLQQVPIQTPIIEPQSTKTPTPPPPPVHHHHKASNELRKPVTPDHLKLPKAFKYPERYTSPTDMMMSPVTKGLLARNKKGAAKLPPGIGAKYQPKVPEMCLQDVSTFQNKLPMMIDEKINST
ncbi:uncharacterized protein LOC127121311 [Lathyrus oleraceus]|uniref:Uncharacterized protein n=1 Tax=Pisum sativum TaxID=3888 RepID=A0A9D5GVI2_PEA|nr:uncharacterized protein LOC127121311 [Pisum sativum]KAI5442788.1 hypothetical protein KIW84_011710 [Pisum sativum]